MTCLEQPFHQLPSAKLGNMANSTEDCDIVCTRCNHTGHRAKDCSRPFFAKSVEERRAEAAKSREEWEARQKKRDEREKKYAEWEAKQAEWKAKQAQWEARRRSKKDFDEESDATDLSTAASITCIVVDEAEVERLALMDKEVRKFAKVLRDIEKLEGRSDLDELQKKKIARKHDLEVDFESAKGIAKVLARDQLRRQVRGY